jgi:hypothetical protein
MSLNHDDEFIDDVNYGNRFPVNWYYDNAPGITFRKANLNDNEKLSNDNFNTKETKSR